MGGAVLFEGGRVYTGRRYAEALLVDAGRVVAAGPADEVRRVRPTGAERLDLRGALVVPGLADAHVHVAELARLRTGPPLEGVGTAEELFVRLSGWAAGHPDGAVVGRGLDLASIPRAAWPTSRDLDRAVGDRPAVVFDRSGHVALVSGAVLAHAELEALPEAVRREGIGRGPDGAPNGLLYEEAMRRLVAGVVEREVPSAAVVRATLDGLVARGLTTIGAMSVASGELAALADAVGGSPRSPAIRAYLKLADASGARAGPVGGTAGRVAVAGVKVFLDGAFGPRTASLEAPYADGDGGRGLEVGDDVELARALAEAAGRGLQPAVHAIGDRAVVRASRLLSGALGAGAVSPRIEHASLVPPEVLPSLLRSRPTLVVQPGFLGSDTWLADRLGPSRARWAYPFRTLADHGLALAGSSDAPFSPPDPWEGLRAAVERRDRDGRSANAEPSERLPWEEALGLYTAGAHRAVGDLHGGSLEPGARADLVVLSVPRLSLVPGVPTPVREVWVGGARAYRADA